MTATISTPIDHSASTGVAERAATLGSRSWPRPRWESFEPVTVLNTIPTFPIFKAPELTDRGVLAAFTARFAPYSEFNLVNQWCWHEKYQAISQVHGNLVVRFHDYIGRPFHTFLGTHALVATAREILDFTQREHLPAELRLVPDVVLAHDPTLKDEFEVTEDCANAEYLLPIADWVSLTGRQFADHRRCVRRFADRPEISFGALELTRQQTQVQILALFDAWVEQKRAADAHCMAELRSATQRTFLVDPAHLIAYGMYERDRLIAFFIGEPLGTTAVLAHFWTADRSYRGLYSYLLHRVCRELSAMGHQLLNFEQDLGEPGLAHAKRSYQPCGSLRKFTLRARPSAG